MDSGGLASPSADIYVTTGVRKSVVEEHAGSLFVIRGPGVKRLAANAFAG